MVDPSTASPFPLELSLDELQEGCVTDFDLAVAIGSERILYATKPYSWSAGELERLRQRGHTHLYYSRTDTKRVQVFRQLSGLVSVDERSNPRERVVRIVDLAADFTRLLYSEDDALTDASIAQGETIAARLATCVQEDPACIQALGNLAEHDDYTYYHSARVAAYAVTLAVTMKLSDEEQLRELALGCLFHDIGKSCIDLTILNKRGKLTDAEWATMKQHPVFGYDLVSPSRLGHIPRQIIRSHHERLDGAGYPDGLSAGELLWEVRLAAFADVFDALTTNRPYQSSRSRFEALDLIRFRLFEQIDKECYRAMVALLGAPTGS